MHDTSPVGHDGSVRRRFPLAVQLLAMQVAIVLAVLVAAGLLAFHLQQQQIREAYAGRVLDLARGLAGQTAVRDAYATADPSKDLQPLAELVRTSAGAEFVVFTDSSGLRYSHPDPAKIGRRVSTDPSIALGGAEFVGTETGTLGVSLRAKVPVRNAAGEVEGQVSVGILESELSADLSGVLPQLVAWLTGAAFLGVLGAVVVTRLVRRRIHGLEPEEIAELLQARDAMLHGIREGVVAVDDRGRLALVNDEAMRLLGLEEDPTRRAADEVLDEDDLLPLLQLEENVSDRIVLVGERVLVVNSTAARVDGRDVGRVLVLRDRTELSDALRALEGQRTITDALRAQAHEFSNNLHVLSGMIELGRSADAVGFIERVGGGSGTLAGATVRHVEDPAVAALVLAKTATAREQGRTLRLDPASRLADGAGDDVVTIVANLVDNALEACGPGGLVELLVRQGTDGDVLVRVSDDGSGVPPGMREQIFELGVSTKVSSNPHQGRGIGLALVARILARRGGSVTVEDRPAGGSVFTAVLPSDVPASAAADAAAARVSRVEL